MTIPQQQTSINNREAFTNKNKVILSSALDDAKINQTAEEVTPLLEMAFRNKRENYLSDIYTKTTWSQKELKNVMADVTGTTAPITSIQDYPNVQQANGISKYISYTIHRYRQYQIPLTWEEVQNRSAITYPMREEGDQFSYTGEDMAQEELLAEKFTMMSKNQAEFRDYRTFKSLIDEKYTVETQNGTTNPTITQEELTFPQVESEFGTINSIFDIIKMSNELVSYDRILSPYYNARFVGVLYFDIRFYNKLYNEYQNSYLFNATELKVQKDKFIGLSESQKNGFFEIPGCDILIARIPKNMAAFSLGREADRATATEINAWFFSNLCFGQKYIVQSQMDAGYNFADKITGGNWEKIRVTPTYKADAIISYNNAVDYFARFEASTNRDSTYMFLDSAQRFFRAVHSLDRSVAIIKTDQTVYGSAQELALTIADYKLRLTKLEQKFNIN
ncbi:MAG: hypothetical protein EVA43_03795 [Flavobacteriales bacterium]|nr:MAG: hypothetical protein EVA43_03795 [Flavobacteriales bacterium]